MMKEVNSLFLFALDLNHVLQDSGNTDIAAHPSSPTLKCKHCRVILECKCNNKKCENKGEFVSVNMLSGHRWPECACTGCKRPAKVLSLLPNCEQGCFSGDADSKIDQDKFELIQKEHMELFSKIEPILSFCSFMCKEFGYERVVSALDVESIESICEIVLSFWFRIGVTFKACICFFGFAKELILHMHEKEHPLKSVAMDVLSSFMRTNVAQFMADPNDWNKARKEFFTKQTSILNEMERRLRDVDKQLDSCLALQYMAAKAFNIAVVGVTGSGKSSLINALRGVRPGAEGAAGVGVTETTLRRSQYAIPNNSNMVLNDLPGIGSVNMTEEVYLSIVEFACYDFFILVTSGKIKGRDIWFAQQIRKHGKAFFFVKTKIDTDIENEIYDKGISATETISKLRKECETELKNIGLNDTEIFLVSSRKTNKPDFAKLKAHLESGTDIENMSRARKRLALMQKIRQTKIKRQEVYIQIADCLQDVATSLDNESRNIKKLKVSTASISLVCGITSSACLLAAPLTLGASLIPGIVLGAIAAASGATTAGSSVVESIRRKTKVTKMKARVASFAGSDNASVGSFERSGFGIAETLETIKGAGAITGSTVGITLRTIESGAARTLSSLAKVARVGGGIVGLVAVPFDVYTIVTQSMDLHKGNYSAVAQDIRKQKETIEKELYLSMYKRRCPHSHRCAYMF